LREEKAVSVEEGEDERGLPAEEVALRLGHGGHVAACFSWIRQMRMGGENGAMYMWYHNGTRWHCQGIVREYLYGKLQLGSHSSSIRYLLYAHARA
ncbi:unnamed protein product, partial [Chrysoparadoxa australica]